MYLLYMVLLMLATGLSFLNFHFYGRTHLRHNALYGEAQKDKITAESIPGLRLTIAVGTIALVLSAVAGIIRLIYFMGPQHEGDYIWITIGLSIFVTIDVVKSMVELKIIKTIK